MMSQGPHVPGAFRSLRGGDSQQCFQKLVEQGYSDHAAGLELVGTYLGPQS